MSDILTWINSLKRPGLLVRAAKLGLADYDREKVLKKVSASGTPEGSPRALEAMIPVEEALNQARRDGDASYVPSRHVEILAAILAEFRLLRTVV